MKKTTSRSRAFMVIAFTLATVFGLSGCLIFYALEREPSGLPCGGENNTTCREGWFCLEGLCSKAAEGDVGSPCNAEEECKDGLTCQDFFNADACPEGDISANCTRANELGIKGKACRQICDPNEIPPKCAIGERCYVDPEALITGWCQGGTCGLDSECGQNSNNGINNLCVFISNKETSGLCVDGCDPLSCSPQGGCAGCPTDQGGCEPYEELTRLGCIPPGNVAHGDACDNVNLFCSPGSFCNIPPGSGAGYCARYCRFPNGAPECNVGQTCNSMGVADWGFCG